MVTRRSATIHRWRRWLTVWTALSLPAASVAILAWGPVKFVGTAATVAIPVVAVLIVIEREWRRENAAPLGQVVGWIGLATLCAVAFVVSIAMIAALVPSLALLLLLVACATAPPVTDIRHRVLRGPEPSMSLSGPAEPVAAPPASPPVTDSAQEMTQAELCCAWRLSFWSLRDTRDPVAKLTIVRHRQRLLEELENRNSAGLEAWFASGARASGSPEKFLDEGGGGQPNAA